MANSTHQPGNKNDARRCAPAGAKRGKASPVKERDPLGEISALQQSLGNQGVLRRAQAKLAINQPGDVYEQEADRVAETVMASPGGGTQPLAVATAPGAQVQRKCATCEDEEKQAQVQRKESSPTQPTTVPPVVGQALNAAGQPLDRGTRDLMEPRFGYDFGGVRVHTDSHAADSARAINAHAYTVGRDIVFAPDKYQPRSVDGQRLLAHELTHVVQQRSAFPDFGSSLRMAESASGEQQAASASRDASPGPIGTAPVGVARQAVNAEAGGLPEPDSVELVEISCSSNTISFYTNQGLYRYALDKCDLSDGEYDAKVSTKGNNVDFDLGETAESGVRFSFHYVLLPGQTNPSRFFKGQSDVRVIARTTGQNLPVNPSIASLTYGTYVDNFADAVYDIDYNKQGTSLSTWLRVRYGDGTVIDINIYSLEDKKMTGQEVRDSIAQGYVGKGGRVFPLRMNAQTTPKLWAAREEALEEMAQSNIDFMTLSLQAVMIVITIPAMPAGNPEGAGAGIKATSRRVPRGSGNLPPVEGEGGPPPVKTEEQLKTSGKTTSGTAGDKAASAKALAKEEANAAPGPPLPAEQQKISTSLQSEHPGLNPEVANDAAKGGASAAGKGGKGADVPLLNGGGREVSVHQSSSPFTADSIGSHLQKEAMQSGTTEVYLQVNSTGATREGFLKMLPDIRNAYLELRGVMVKVFGPDGKVWWSGLFGGPQ